MSRALQILVLATALAAAGGAHALPVAAPLAGEPPALVEPVQAFCGPYRCFARPFWRYRSGAGFLPYRRFGFAPARPRFAPFGFRRFGDTGGSAASGASTVTAASAAGSAVSGASERRYSTVTDLARLRGWSASFPMKTAV